MSDGLQYLVQNQQCGYLLGSSKSSAGVLALQSLQKLSRKALSMGDMLQYVRLLVQNYAYIFRHSELRKNLRAQLGAYPPGSTPQ